MWFLILTTQQRWLFLFPISPWENQVIERWNHLAKVSQLSGAEPGFEIIIVWLQSQHAVHLTYINLHFTTFHNGSYYLAEGMRQGLNLACDFWWERSTCVLPLLPGPPTRCLSQELSLLFPRGQTVGPGRKWRDSFWTWLWAMLNPLSCQLGPSLYLPATIV